MIQRLSLFSAIILMAFVALTGCASSDKFKVMEQRAENPARPLRVMVRDFADKRTREEKSYINFAKVPLNFYGGYFYYDLHDAKFPTQSAPFPTLVAKHVAERLNEVGVFDKVEYVAPDANPQLGDYDLELKGTINRLRTRGRINYYGLSIFGDFIHYTAVPKFVRRWEIDWEYQLVDAYTGEPVGEPKQVKMITRRTSLSTYANRGETKDLEKKMVPAIDEYITKAWSDLPGAQASEWVALKERGAQVIASRQAESQAIADSRKPRFRFLSPGDGEVVRGATAPLRWDVTAPGKLKNVVLVANNEPVSLGINPLDLAVVSSAPTTIQPREAAVPLKLGANKLEALVEDHTGESSRASITVTRLPQPLTPARRYALLIGADSPAAAAGVASLAPVLADPMYGQFPADSVTTVTSLDDAAAVRQMLTNFGSKPVSGDLALIYVACKGDWESGKILGGAITLGDFLKAAAESTATENVVVVADIDWNAAAGTTDVLAKTGAQLRQGWAFMTPQSTGGPAIEANGTRAFSAQFIDVMKGVGSDATRVTVERFLNDLTVGYEPKTSGKSVPDFFGRYNRSNTMVERQ
ncbi:hypothetical protein GC173_09945 [bacterium]|nr:hypothetical protein [bacterium]